MTASAQHNDDDEMDTEETYRRIATPENIELLRKTVRAYNAAWLAKHQLEKALGFRVQAGDELDSLCNEFVLSPETLDADAFVNFLCSTDYAEDDFTPR